MAVPVPTSRMVRREKPLAYTTQNLAMTAGSMSANFLRTKMQVQMKTANAAGRRERALAPPLLEPCTVSSHAL